MQKEKTSALEKTSQQAEADRKEAQKQLKKAKERKRSMVFELSVTNEEIGRLEKIARIQKWTTYHTQNVTVGGCCIVVATYYSVPSVILIACILNKNEKKVSWSWKYQGIFLDDMRGHPDIIGWRVSRMIKE